MGIHLGIYNTATFSYTHSLQQHQELAWRLYKVPIDNVVLYSTPKKKAIPDVLFSSDTAVQCKL